MNENTEYGIREDLADGKSEVVGSLFKYKKDIMCK
jgi:hypothetical protein